MRRARCLAVLASTVIWLSACGSAPGTTDPTGVDGLQIPAPALDPGDFVDVVDNPYFPLTPGSQWTYTSSDGSRTTTVQVAQERREIEGISATVVQTQPAGRDASPAEQTEDWYAQDRAGNVWHLGTSASWEAGQGEALAGVAMLASPRQGDGYREELAPDVATDVLEVITINARVELADEAYDGVVKLEATSPLRPGVVEERYYAQGIGLVLAEADGDQQLILTDFRPG